MGRTVLSIVEFSGLAGQTDAFKRACRQANVSFRCEAVFSAEEGIRYLEGAGPYVDRETYPPANLVVLDWELEGRGSSAVLSWIRAQLALKYLPVIVLSQSKSQTAMRRAYDTGATSYLLKPEDLPGLIDLVRLIDRYWLTLNQTPAS